MTGAPDGTSWIDPEACRPITTRWVDAGDTWFRLRFDIAGMADRLDLEGAAVPVLAYLADASEEMWITAAALRLAADRAVAADAAVGGCVAASDEIVDEWRRLRLISGAGVDAAVSTWPGVIAAWRQSPPGGDAGETFDADLRAPFVLEDPAGRPVGLARSMVVQAIGQTSDAVQIGPDEFELVRLGERQFLVILPGVTDLSHPRHGLDDRHRTVRDLDRFAVPSAVSTSVDGNRYARMVWDGMLAAGVPIGSEVIIVGHSFGADTAMDLAADPRFNGAAGYAVTHVVAAGYDSEPQLSAVPDRTAVLVVQNRRDLVVIAEAAVGGAVRDGPWAGSAVLDDGVRFAGPRQVIDVFAGGSSGAGHDPRLYAEHVTVQDDPFVRSFLASLGDRLEPGIWPSSAVDVSVPIEE